MNPKKVYLICPVRNATDSEKKFLEEYKKVLKQKSVSVFYPTEDNPHEQTDTRGLLICQENLRAIKEADEIHVYWNSQSTGSMFDFGMAFALGKRIVLINKDGVKSKLVPGQKSFETLLFDISK